MNYIAAGVNTPAHHEGQTIFYKSDKVPVGNERASSMSNSYESTPAAQAAPSPNRFCLVGLGQQAFAPSIAANPSLWTEIPYIDERENAPNKDTEDFGLPVTGNELLVLCGQSLHDFLMFATFTQMLRCLAPLRTFRKNDSYFYLLSTELDDDTVQSVAECAAEHVMEMMGPMVPKAQS